MEKKIVKFEEMMERLALNCKEGKINGFCILSTQGEQKTGVAALQSGDPAEIIMAMIKVMQRDERARVILETAVQYYNSYEKNSQPLEIAKVYKN